MRGICLIGLLVMSYQLAANAVPSTPYATKGEQDNDRLSDEDVAAYFRNKFETDNVQPAMVMEYLIKLMSSQNSGSSISTIASDSSCLEEGTDNSLSKSQIERILDTVYPEVGKPTLITPDGGKTMYVHDTNPRIAYQDLISAFPETANIYANYSPCRFCVLILQYLFTGVKDKPTIHVGRVNFTQNSLSDAILDLQCLARLIHDGFDIVAWNFNTFKSSLTEDCADEIDGRIKDADFDREYMNLVSQLDFIRQLGTNPHAHTWCDSQSLI